MKINIVKKKFYLLCLILKTLPTLFKYGNIFYRVVLPFERYLYDPRDNIIYPLESFKGKIIYDASTLKYEVVDPKNILSRIWMSFKDRHSLDNRRFGLRYICPKNIAIRHNFYGHKEAYVYKFEDSFFADVKAGKLSVVNKTSTSMLKAIAKNEDFLFADDMIFHFRLGAKRYGWGMPYKFKLWNNFVQRLSSCNLWFESHYLFWK